MVEASEHRTSTRPRKRAVLIAALAVVLVGLSAFTFFYAKGPSYFSDDPRGCANCHIMRDYFDAWNRGPHKAVATCNGCHTPEAFFGHYAVKGINGVRHSFAFTTGFFHEPIAIKALNKSVVRANCVRCHDAAVARMAVNGRGEKAECATCHRRAGHWTRR